jgi:hypothetical protein
MKKERNLKTVLVLEDNALHRKERCYHALKESIGSGS